MRLNRYLASAGLGSRRSCEDLIREGRVNVNGKTVTDLATTVGENDQVSVDGKKQKPDQPYTLAMFKPEGVLCSRDAQGRRKTVFDLLPEDAPRLFYVGRLDMDSEGLLILTNRGELAQQLAHPSFKLPKVYHVELDKDFDFALVPRFLKGFLIEHGYAKAEAVYKIGHNRVKVVLTQGLKRQIRLMFLKFGYRVKFLRRIEIGSLSLGNMKVGEWRFLNDYEVNKLLLAPVVREEEAPKTFGKLRDLSQAVPTPSVEKKKAKVPVAERYGRKSRPASAERYSRPARPARFEKSDRSERSGPPKRGAGGPPASRPSFGRGAPRSESRGSARPQGRTTRSPRR
jgi:23S rRNA pseudouridine2605 synthase